MKDKKSSAAKSRNAPRGPENGMPDSRASKVGMGKKTSTKSKGFK